MLPLSKQVISPHFLQWMPTLLNKWNIENMKGFKADDQSPNKFVTTYAQHWWLRFKNPISEKRFVDKLFSHQKTWPVAIFISLIFAISLLLLGREMTVLSIYLSLLSILIFLTIKIEKSYMCRAIAEIIVIQFIIATIGRGSLPEIYIAFVPSSILNYYFLKAWTCSLFINLLEILLVWTIRDICMFQTTLVVLFHVFCIGYIEKDLKSLWVLYRLKEEKWSRYEQVLNESENCKCGIIDDEKVSNNGQKKKISKVNLKEEGFNLHVEVACLIDEIYKKASRKDITVIYSRDSSIPSCTLGDKKLYIYILRCLFEAAIDYSTLGADLLFHLKGPSSYTEECGIEYQISFHSEKATQEGLNKLFVNHDANAAPKSKSFEIPIKTNSKLSLFGTILELLKGRVNHCLFTVSKNRAILSVFIPIVGSKKWIEPTFIPIYSHPEILPNNSIKWKPEKFKISEELSKKKRKTVIQMPEYIEPPKNYDPVSNKKIPYVIEILSETSNISSADYSQDCDENVQIGAWIVGCSKTNSGILTPSPRSYIPPTFQNSKSMPENQSKHITWPYKKKVFTNSKENSFPSPNYTLTDNRPIFRLLACDSNENNSLKTEAGTFKVLIVDDMASHREFLEVNLSAITHINAEHAKDGNEAWKMYEAYAKSGYMYKAIFMDLMMPKMDGYKSTQKIRNIEKENGHNKTLICGMSGDNDAREKCLRAGMDEFLIKPPQIIELKIILSRVGAEVLNEKA
ncbi:unnamed protein product [Blepharisma stoltei]|uniref:Response regulatory domain-containing protein n=1 Tax=Blepharisma stoltei TaxID=1481888 RepID=A0AAU9JVJ8_9CILI|nr:unnamed protein product [Blepharisma stoltei]